MNDLLMVSNKISGTDIAKQKFSRSVGFMDYFLQSLLHRATSMHTIHD